MESATDNVAATTGDAEALALQAPGPMALPARPLAPQLPALMRGLLDAAYTMRWTILVYFGTRVLLIAVAIVNGALRHQPVLNELANWDGFWYRSVANKGYHDFPDPTQNNLGFLPLYPMAMWAVAHALTLVSHNGIIWLITLSGVVISTIGGLVATMIVHELAAGWWGAQNATRVAAFFCIFPGSVVFTMVYAEGLIIPLAAGCILALARRRWVLAGILAGLATAAGPEAFMLMPACGLAALREVRRRGWSLRAARRSLLAPVLSVTGAAAFATFLWIWTGSPMASYQAQHQGWDESTSPLALLHVATTLFSQLTQKHFDNPTINLNLVAGLIGAMMLVVCLALLHRCRREVSPEAIAWTLGISFLATTSTNVPPNPRLLITAFPAIMVLANRCRGRAYVVLLAVNGLLLVGMSALTFVGFTLRP